MTDNYREPFSPLNTLTAGKSSDHTDIVPLQEIHVTKNVDVSSFDV